MLSDLSIKLTTFYKTGIFCFLVIGIGNLYSLTQKWAILDAGGAAASIFTVVFNFALVLFFNYLRKTAPPQLGDGDMPSEAELNEFMEELK